MAWDRCFWLLFREIYPVAIRGRAMRVAAIANWGANFIVTVSLLTLLSAIGADRTFVLFGVLTVLAVAYFYEQVPGTKTGTLPQIERDMGLSPDALDEAAPAHPAAA